MAADERTWTTHQLARLSGMSYRRVDYAVRTGVLACAIPANGSGTYRRFSSRQVTAARVLALLADLGAGAAVLRAVAVWLSEEDVAWSERVLVSRDGRIHRWTSQVPAVAGWLVDLAQVWADAEQAMAAELDGELALVG